MKIRFDQQVQGFIIEEEFLLEEKDFIDDSRILLKFQKDFVITVDSVQIDGKEIKKLSRKINDFFIHIKKDLAIKKKISVKYKIFSLFRKKMIINDNCFYFPLNLLNRENISKIVENGLINIEFSIDKSWELLEPSKHTIVQSKNRNIFIFQAKKYDIILFSKKIKLIDSKQLDGIKYSVLMNNENFLIPNTLNLNKKNIKTIERINGYLNYIKKYIKTDIDEIKILTVQLSFFAYPFGNTIVANEFYIHSIVNNYGQSSSYHIIKALALMLLKNRYKKYDMWFIESLAHYIAINYNKEINNKNLGELNSLPIANFFSGNKNSPYATSSAKFREIYRYESLKKISDYKIDPLIDYDYRMQAVYNHWGTQVLKNLELNYTINKKNDLFIKKLIDFINSSDNLYWSNFLDYLESSNKLLEQYKRSENTTLESVDSNFESIDNKIKIDREKIDFITNDYPYIDLRLNFEKENIYLVKSGQEKSLFVLVEYHFKDKTKKQEVYEITKKKTKLPYKLSQLINIKIDPDNIIEEMNESNNNLFQDFHFSIIAPPIVQNKYAIALNQSIINYKRIPYIFAGSISGGWNLKSFNYNSLNRPFLFWSFDGGFSPFFVNNKYDDYAFNIVFETSLAPRLMYIPQLYINNFLNKNEIMGNIGTQGFIPPVRNTEYDNVFFNQSVDLAYIFKVNINEIQNIENWEFSVSSGYKNFLKVYFFSIETLNGFSIGFKDFTIKNIVAGGTLHFKFAFDFLLLENITGILKTFYFTDDTKNFDLVYPSINRGNTVIHSQPYFQKILSKTSPPQGIGYTFDFDQTNSIFNSLNIIFRFPLYKEPLMDPMVTNGFGFSEDLFFTFHNNKFPEFYNDLLTFSLVLNVQERISLLFKIPIFSSKFIYENKFNYKPGFYFEVRTYL